jgi:hypothetical protein
MIMAQDPIRQSWGKWNGDPKAPWPYCDVCKCFSDVNHVSGKKHMLNVCISQKWKPEAPGSRVERLYCRACECWSDMAHVDSQDHREALVEWEAQEEQAWPTMQTTGSSASMKDFLMRMTVREGFPTVNEALRSLSRKILMKEQVKDWFTYDIVNYLKEYAPPRFLDRQQLTGRIQMVQGRHNRASLVRCVELLEEAWREALQTAGLTGSEETENAGEDEEAEEELDAIGVVELLAKELESLCLEPLVDYIDSEASPQ